MVAYPLLWGVTSADYYPSMKNKQKTLYVRSSCIFKRFLFTDTKKEAKEIVNIIY